MPTETAFAIYSSPRPSDPSCWSGPTKRGMIKRRRSERNSNGSERSLTRFPGKAPITFRRMAVYAWITGILTEEAGYGVSRLRVQKVAYLLEHGLSLGIFRKHAKHPYGPYDPSLTYRDAEPGCLKEGYLQKSDGGLLEPGPKLAKAQNYARRYLREESVARALVLHVSGLDEWSLETLTTVHSVVAEMARSTVDAKAVSQAIRADAKWQSKLHRDNFTTKRIVEALRVLSLLRMA